jgi:hypothetical protein
VKRSRYKYVSNIDHARWLQQGKMFHRTAAYYRDYEDQKATEVIGDQYECTRLYRPGNIRKRNPDGTPGEWQPMPPDQRMECITRAHEIFVFCVSLSLNDVLKKAFEAIACVEIFDSAEFHARWLKALPKEAEDPRRRVSRKVKYYTENDLMGETRALPDLITTGKLKKFEYQSEYRFAYTKTEAFDFQNCTYQITDRRNRPAPKPEEHLSETLELGVLRDVSRIIEFK